MIRLVLDTNVTVAAFLWSGAPTGIIGLAERHRVELCSCDEAYDEFCRVLEYRRIQRQVERRHFSVSSVVHDYERLHTFFPDPPDCPLSDPIVEDDPDDDLFFLLADHCDASYVITRDDDLHQAGTFNDVAPVDPGDFMRAFRRARNRRVVEDEWDQERWQFWRSD